MTDTVKKLSSQEAIKRESHGLAGNIAAELADANPFVADDSYELLKFHGSYQGYDRDTATARKKQKLDKEWEFMLRLKMPGGRLTAAQYLALDAMCDARANGSLRVTTRQTFQFHQIVKGNLKPFIAEVNRILLSTLGGCGDVVRNVITCPAPIKDNIHAVLEENAFTLAKYFAPKTQSYWDIWLDGEVMKDYPFIPAPSVTGEMEPIYGDTYMPRKFKIAIGQPEDNCMDALCNDLAFLALFDGQELKGYNVALGGGLGMKHNNAKTYPRLATSLVFVKPADLIRTAETVVKLQRDHGDRSDRQHARLKYVLDEHGLDWARQTLEKYFGSPLEDARPVTHWAIDDHMGWHPQGDGKWFLGVPIPSGRIIDTSSSTEPCEVGDLVQQDTDPRFAQSAREDDGAPRYRTALREVIAEYKMPVLLTNDQNVILADIEEREKPAIAQIFKRHGVKLREEMTDLSRNFLACVALPTCGKALAEAERIQVPVEAQIQSLLDKYGLGREKIAVRIAGCPNGCSRPYVGDIGIVGRMPGHYVLYIGGDFEGTRLNTEVADKVPEAAIGATLEPYVARYKEQRQANEGFGDFWHRVGIEIQHTGSA